MRSVESFETELSITDNPGGGVGPPVGIPDYDPEYSVYNVNAIKCLID